MYLPLWTNLLVAMHDDIENTFICASKSVEVLSVMCSSIARQKGKNLHHSLVYAKEK